MTRRPVRASGSCVTSIGEQNNRRAPLRAGRSCLGADVSLQSQRLDDVSELPLTEALMDAVELAKRDPWPLTDRCQDALAVSLERRPAQRLDQAQGVPCPLVGDLGGRMKCSSRSDKTVPVASSIASKAANLSAVSERRFNEGPAASGRADASARRR